jgi:hypothetical protein
MEISDFEQRGKSVTQRNWDVLNSAATIRDLTVYENLSCHQPEGTKCLCPNTEVMNASRQR